LDAHPRRLPERIKGHKIHIVGETYSKRLSLRPDGLIATPVQTIRIHHGTIQQPERIQDIEGKIRDDPLRGEIFGKALSLVAAPEEGLVVYPAFTYAR
jgi:hypothetical protein